MKAYYAASQSDQTVGPAASSAPRDFYGGVHEPTSPTISIRNLDFYYDEAGRPKQVLFDVDLDIWPGEVGYSPVPRGVGRRPS